EGQKLLSDSIKTFNKSEISDADRAKAIDRWREGNKAVDDAEKKEKDAVANGSPLDPKQRTYAYELAAHLFKEATDLDPSLCSARLSRALVLYEQLHQPREAENELKLILSRFAPEDATYPRLLATYHLGRLAQLESEFRKAERYFEDAAHLDATFYH